ncbi:S8 family peptidase [Natronococcus wangiae]|uniref:S8 family peptidase n=1 Tax=Natronococcus wangiae TaxID=3068275 RepID=UPI00273D2A10|nr:S8 family peptidase [Natronococcus sp. AD5]
MSDRKPSISEFSRRKVLQGAGAAGAAGLLFGGTISAQSNQDNEPESEEEPEDPSTITEEARFNVGYSNSDGAQMVEKVADEVCRKIEPIGMMTINAGLKELQEFQESDDVDFIEVDLEVQVDLPPQDIQAQQEPNGQIVPWGIERIGSLEAHESGFRGENVDVAVLDSGIYPSHEDLYENIGEGFAPIPCQGDCEEEWDDDHGHGTHVAGTIAALDNEIGVLGVAPDITLHSVKVLDENNAGTISAIVDGLVWTAEQGYDIANMSLGGPNSLAMQLAIEFAHEQGVLLVAAAGNAGLPQVSFPAAYEETIAVSATTPEDTHAVFSNFGPEIELAAPGVEILSTLPPNVTINPTSELYGELQGTSMATPHVSGVGALLMALGYSAEETREFMNETAEDLGLPPEEQGSGLVNAAAVEAEPEPSDPVRELLRLVNEAVQLVQQAVQLILSGGSLDEARRLLRNAAQLLQEAREIFRGLDESEASEVRSDLTSAEDDLAEAECLLTEEE